MGMMQGKTMGDTFVVLDSFALPVEGVCARARVAYWQTTRADSGSRRGGAQARKRA
jgi:hypothetical protein